MQIEVVKGNIIDESTDAIVNAANKALFPGGGVDGAITSAAGPKVLTERMAIGGCNTGDAVATDGGNLKCKYIIYAVGPRYTDHKPELLQSAYKRSMEIALENGCKSIAFPAISAGIYGFPAIEAAELALKAISKFSDEDILVRFIMFTDETYKAFRQLIID
jgi:O-acetyl-ADP-ribose deacetylase (regulator of RNase III)